MFPLILNIWSVKTFLVRLSFVPAFVTLWLSFMYFITLPVAGFTFCVRHRVNTAWEIDIEVVITLIKEYQIRPNSLMQNQSAKMTSRSQCVVLRNTDGNVGFVVFFVASLRKCFWTNKWISSDWMCNLLKVHPRIYIYIYIYRLWGSLQKHPALF